MAAALTRGCLAQLRSAGSCEDNLTLQVKSFFQFKDKYKCTFSDGADSMAGMLSSQLSELVPQGSLGNNAIVRLTAYTCNNVNNSYIIIATDLDVLEKGVNIKSEDVQMAEADGVATVHIANSAAGMPKTPPIKKEGDRNAATPGPAPSPSEEPAAKYAKTPTGATPRPGPSMSTPPSTLAKSAKTTGFHKIDALHPYDDTWCIKVKLTRKYPLRSISIRGQDTAKFSAEFTDDAGRSIQATFWRTQAERNADLLQEGRVYVLHRFQVKPANKAYTSVKNDYEIHVSDKTEISEAADQSGAETMTAAVELVPIEQLIKHVTRKAPVDVLGVVVSVGSMGTIKRRTDSSEVSRRDVTLADQSGKSVVLTLWGDAGAALAAEPGGGEGVVLQCTGCRVTDYKGCSLSTLSRSVVSVNPDSPEANALKDWWISGGSTATLTPVGGEAAEGGPSSGPSSGASRRDALHTLREVVPARDAALPDPSAKPVYHNVLAAVAGINTEQPMFYLANPENGKKVVEQEGRYWCEGDNKYIDSAQHRYVMQVRLMDATTSTYVSLFNEQAELILGATADELASLKSSDKDAFEARVKRSQWGSWAVTVSSKSREYNGERKMRHTAQSVKVVDFAVEGSKLLELINRY